MTKTAIHIPSPPRTHRRAPHPRARHLLARSGSTAQRANPVATIKPPVLAEQWPALGAALRQYDQRTAESFSRQAYDCVMAGLIRQEDRRALAAFAEDLGIRPFDAQLLIACAIRQWALDHAHDATPSPQAPRLSFEYKSWSRAWTRFALVSGTALTLDCIILYFWLAR